MPPEHALNIAPYSSSYMTMGGFLFSCFILLSAILLFWWVMGIERRQKDHKSQAEKDSAYLSKHKLVLGERVSVLDEDGELYAAGELLKVSQGNAVVLIKKEKQHIPLSQVVPFRRRSMRGSLN